MFNIQREEFDWGGRPLVLETGKIARQADGAVLATYGDTTDAVPEPFVFPAQQGVTPGALVSTAALAVTGLQRRAAVTIDGGAWRTLNALDGDRVVQDWTSADGRLDPFQKLQLRTDAPVSGGTSRTVTVTVGPVASAWTVTR